MLRATNHPPAVNRGLAKRSLFAQHRGSGFAGPLVLPPGEGMGGPHEVGKPGGAPYFLSMLKRPAPKAAMASRPPAIAMFLKNISWFT